MTHINLKFNFFLIKDILKNISGQGGHVTTLSNTLRRPYKWSGSQSYVYFANGRRCVQCG